MPPASPSPVRIAIFGGSLRRDSLNTRLRRVCVEIAERMCDVLELEIADLPLYNQDLDPGFGYDVSRPDAVERFWRQMSSANGLVIVSPEYNWTIPSVIKNAIEWVSRPPFDTPLTGRPTLLVGGSTGPAGTGRAMAHLRQVLQSTRTPVLVDDLQVPFVQTQFGPDGKVDRAVDARLEGLLAQLVEAAERARDENLPEKLCVRIPPEVVRGEVIPGRSPG